MEKYNIKNIEAILNKINYLYQFLTDGSKDISRPELDLLKRYTLELYDKIIEAELAKHSATPAPVPATSTPVVEQPPTPQPEPTPTPAPVAEPEVKKVEPAPEPEPTTYQGAETEVLEKPDLEKLSANNTKTPVFDMTAEPEPPVTPALSDDADKTEVLTDVLRKIEQEKNEQVEAAKTLAAEKIAPPIKEEQDINQTLSNNNSNQKDVVETLKSNNDGGGFSVSLNERIAFTNELFEGNANVYEGTMKELGKCDTLIDALTYINLHVRNQYKWKDDSSTVRDFTNVLRKKFMS